MSMTMQDPKAPAATGAPAEPVSTTGTGKACIPCDVPPFCRNHYYRGKLLTEREFADEQRYVGDRHRLHQMALHGWGVVCGLKVKPHPYCPEQKLVIEEGLAIDSCGREIRVFRDVTIDLPRLPDDKKPDTKKPDDKNGHKDGGPPKPGATDGGHEGGGHEGGGHEGGEHEGGREDECVPEPPARTLYLCIAYTECESEFSPAPFDECGCNTGGLKPNRICDGFTLELYDSKPGFWDEAVGDECEAEDCREYYWEGERHCRRPGGYCCVPLAMILDVVPGQKVTEHQIHTRANRRHMASTETLDRVVRCILNKLPAETLTRIDDTNWEHDQRYLCREFMSEFISSADHKRGFRISFNEKVHADTITQRSFEARVVFRSDDPAQPRRMEIAPAEILKDEGETHWCRLAIDPTYARNNLDMRDFDLFLTLRCDQVTDLRGLAVDGNFIARRFPTGDNVQGGTFESWIRVRPRHIPA
jgi:hypothetical protein